jgi:predicted nucleic acid-binding protein
VNSEDLAVPAVAIGELQVGAELTRMQDRDKAAQLDSWIGQIVSSYQVIAMDAACFREFARLIQGRSDTLREDAMIAATARIHGLTIATRNERGFRSFAVPLFNPFRN